MRIDKWTTANIFFNESERKVVNKVIKRYIKNGWDLNDEGDSGDDKYEICTQLISQTKGHEVEK